MTLNNGHFKVHLNNENMLVWPVMFVYPEYGQTDFIQAFEEDCSLGAMLQSMFEERPPWDEESKVGFFEVFRSDQTISV